VGAAARKFRALASAVWRALFRAVRSLTVRLSKTTATEDNIQLRCRSHNQYEGRRDFPQVLRELPIYDGAPRGGGAWLVRCVKGVVSL
jgi:hypothetical protein